LEGNHLVGITATGDGKTCIFYYIVIIMLFFAQHGWKPPRGRSWPKHPIGLIVLPVIGIEEQMAETCLSLSLPCVMLNGDTLRADPSLWTTAALDLTCMILLSAEMLRSDRFQGLLDVSGFLKRLALLGVDELHLLLTWGKEFRKAFQQIGYLNSRLDSSTRIVAVTASLQPGVETVSCCNFLGLSGDGVIIDRRSCLRGNLRLERQFVSQSGPHFPELRWLVRSGIKAVVFCGSIGMAFRVAVDFW
ncbi:hypothetical protein AURDEDRAFT_18860, partial [Auricularia subglabra TFB-10046 SS5]